jgi:UDP-N-acetylmuramate: L-alanyl-gamma-D-glutamyl-meso-diaminopimelate ligase
MSDSLARMEIPVMCPFSEENLSWGPDTVVVGNVCRRDHREVLAAQAAGVPLTSFPAILGDRILPGRRPVIVAGTHGKTTTTTLLSYLLERCGKKPGWFIGGIPNDLPSACSNGEGLPFVLEGDEYDTAFFDKGSKFLHYQPFAVLLTGVEFDHADIFADLAAVTAAFEGLVRLVPEAGVLLSSADNDIAVRLSRERGQLTYGLAGEDADFFAVTLEKTEKGTSFELHDRRAALGRYFVPMVGDHNLRNTVGALAMCIRLDVAPDELTTPLSAFTGVRRRQEELGRGRGIVAVDDFGHHPTAIRVTLAALLQRYPGRRPVLVFEPRSATSRRAVFQREYAQVLGAAPRVLLAPAYDQSRIAPGDRLDLERLAADITACGSTVSTHPDFNDLLGTLRAETRSGDLVIFFSSGAMGGIKLKFAKDLEG